MTRVSKRPVKRSIFLKINDQFIKTVIRAKTASAAKRFINDLFTDAEKTMFSKRLAVILMLKHGYSFEIIRKTLKVSQSTIARLWKSSNERKFDFLVAGISKNKKRGGGYLVDLEALLKFNMPTMVGRGRWRGALRKIRN